MESRANMNVESATKMLRQNWLSFCISTRNIMVSKIHFTVNYVPRISINFKNLVNTLRESTANAWGGWRWVWTPTTELPAFITWLWVRSSLDHRNKAMIIWKSTQFVRLFLIIMPYSETLPLKVFPIHSKSKYTFQFQHRYRSALVVVTNFPNTLQSRHTWLLVRWRETLKCLLTLLIKTETRPLSLCVDIRCS